MVLIEYSNSCLLFVDAIPPKPSSKCFIKSLRISTKLACTIERVIASFVNLDANALVISSGLVLIRC